MAIRNLSIIKNEIVQLTVELRQLLRRQHHLRDRMILAEESSRNCVDRIVSIRASRGIDQYIITAEIRDIQDQIDELDYDVSEFEAEINQIDIRACDLLYSIKQKQQEYRQLSLQNRIQGNGEEEEEE